jgi:thiol-disulfide isomerase/thioredoxin
MQAVDTITDLGGAKPSQMDPSVTVIGKIHANWCGHCKSLVPEWKKMKNAVNKSDLAKKYTFEEIESASQDPKIKFINNNHLKNSATKLSLQGGYPTLFKIKDGKLSYYKGPRRAADMTNWYTNHAVKVVSDEKVPQKMFGFFSGGKRRNRTRKTRSKKNRKTRNKKTV